MDPDANQYAGVRYISKIKNYTGKGMRYKGSQSIELPIPSEIFKASAKTLGQINDGIFYNMAQNYYELISLILYIANTPRPTSKCKVVWSLVPSATNDNDFVQQRLRLWYSDERGPNLDKRIHDLIIQNERIKQSTIRGAVHVANIPINGGGPPGQGAPGGAMAPAAPSMGGGGDGGGGGQQPQRQQWGSAVRQNKLIKDDQLQPHQRITLAKWASLATMLTCETSEHDVSKMDLAENFYAPTNVMSIERSLDRSMKMKTNAMYWIVPNYFKYSVDRVREGFTFPNKGKHCYMVANHEVTPGNFTKVFFPWITKPKHTMNAEKELFLRMHQHEPDAMEIDRMFGDDLSAKAKYLAQHQDPPEEEEKSNSSQRQQNARKRKLTQKEIGERYENEVNKVMSHENVVTLDKMAEHNKKLMVECNRKCASLDPEMAAAMVKQTRALMLQTFTSQLWNADAQIPAAIQAIVRWWVEFLRTHKNFNMPRKKFSANLDRFGDGIASSLAQLDVAFDVNNVHMEVLGCWLAGIEGYLGLPTHRHILSTGPAFSGKSHTFDMFKVLAIPDTFQMYTYATPKAKTAVTDRFEAMWEVYGEVIPSALGVHKEKNGKASNSSNTDAESLIKDWLTTGKMRVQETVFIDGFRMIRMRESQCNCVVFMATNAYAATIPAPVLSRFSVLQYFNRFRKDTNGLLGQMGRVRNQAEATLLSLRWKRNQALACFILLLVRLNILPPINYSTAHVIISETLYKAQKRHLKNTDNIRSYNRIIATVTSCVVLDAIDSVFDLPGTDAPLFNQPFEYDQIFLVAKHLIAKESHVTFAVGLEEHAYEDRTRKEVLLYIRNAILGVSQATNDEHMVKARAIYKLKSQTESLEDEKKTLEEKYSALEMSITEEAKHQQPDDDDFIMRQAELGDIQNEIKVVDTKLQPLIDQQKEADAFRTANLKRHNEDEATFQHDKGMWCIRIPGLQTQTHSTWQAKTMALASRIHNFIHPKPQLEDVRTVLFTLCEEQIITPSGERVPSIQYDGGDRMLISADVMLSLDQNTSVLFDCLKETRTHAGVRHSEYVYGTCMRDTYHIVRTMKIEEDLPYTQKKMDQIKLNEDELEELRELRHEYNNDIFNETSERFTSLQTRSDEYNKLAESTANRTAYKPAAIRDVNFHEPELIKLSASAMEGVQDNLLDDAPRIVPKEQQKFKRWLVLDYPLDDRATLEHNRDIMLTTQEIEAYPSNFTSKAYEQSLAVGEDHELYLYPDCMKGIDPAYIEQERLAVESDMDEYRLSKAIAEIASKIPALDLDTVDRHLRMLEVSSRRQGEDEDDEDDENEEEEDEEEEEEQEQERKQSEPSRPASETESDDEDDIYANAMPGLEPDSDEEASRSLRSGLNFNEDDDDDTESAYQDICRRPNFSLLNSLQNNHFVAP